MRDYRGQIIQLEMENRSLKKSNIRMQDKVVNYFEEVHCKFVDKVLHYILFQILFENSVFLILFELFAASIKKVSTTAQQELEKKLISREELAIGEVNPATN